jgi:hypothetical protein
MPRCGRPNCAAGWASYRGIARLSSAEKLIVRRRRPTCSLRRESWSSSGWPLGGEETNCAAIVLSALAIDSAFAEDISGSGRNLSGNDWAE